jgi:hypothetical protein
MYPVAIVEDRYGGTYSGGAWIAIDEFDACDVPGGGRRLDHVIEQAHASDTTAWRFWSEEAPELRWLAVGDTPDEALAALRARTPTF